MTPTPIESNFQRPPAHAPHARGVKGPRMRWHTINSIALKALIHLFPRLGAVALTVIEPFKALIKTPSEVHGTERNQGVFLS